MYESFFKMKEKPFQISTDPRFLWLGEKHKEAMANLKYGLLDRNGFVVLTGDVGTGKTTLVNALLSALGENVLVAKINHPSLETGEFLTFIAKTLDPDFKSTDKSGLLLFFNDYLQQAYADGKVVLLLIDEAHRLSMELFEEIRLLSNIEHDGQPLLSIIFVGQNEIKPMLRESRCRALRHRITLFYDIQALLPEETRQYVGYRLQVAGTLENMFTTGALQKIHSLSGGNPRVINILCDRALLTGYVREQHVIDADVIAECGRELDLGDYAEGGRKSGAVSQTLRRWHGTVEKGCAISRDAWKNLSTALQIGSTTLARAYSRNWSRTKQFLDRVSRSAAHLFTKHRRKLLPAALVSSIVMFFAVVAISAFSGAKLPGKALTAKQTGEPVPGEQLLSEKGTEVPVATMPAVQSGNPKTEDSPQTMAPSTAAAESTLVERAAAALERKDYKEALELMESHPMGTSNVDTGSVGLYARALVGRAVELMGPSPDDAEALLVKAIEVSPEMVEPHLILGKRYTRTKDYPRAISAYQQVIGLDPTVSDALFNLGFIYAATGDFKAAEEAFERVVSLNPSYIGKTLFNLAVVQQKLGKREQSIANLEEVVAMGPGNEKALAFLNRLRQTTAEETREQIR